LIPASPLNLALRCCIIGFDGPSLPDDVAEALADGLAGVTLFARNLADRAQVAGLCDAIRRAAEGWPPPVIAVDQEGGRVQRLRRMSPLHPPMREVGGQGPGACRAAGAAIGADLADLGFNLDFAPVLDVDTNAANPIIGDRAFSSDPHEAAGRALAFLEGLEAAGPAGCGKHFPGHGDAAADSHLDLPVIDVGPDLLEARELVPFRAAVDAGVRMIMTAHCLFPRLDPDVPATLSRAVVRGLLRERLGFDGCVITDDLGMKAISDRFPLHDVLVRGLDAGIDAFLHCGANGEGLAMAGELARAIGEGAVRREAVEAAAARVDRLRAGLR
jgi:beta-N-acetylhexosaminidase